MGNGGNFDSPTTGRRFLAVLQSDVFGFTSMLGTSGDAMAFEVRRHLSHFRTLIERHDGQVLADRGDGLKAVFGSAVSALAAALDMQKWAAEANAYRTGTLPPVRHRMGIHASDVLLVEGSATGIAVAVAARLEALAEPGQICVSEEIDKAARHELKYRRAYVGPVSVKGVDFTIRVHRVYPEVAMAPLTDEDFEPKPMAAAGAAQVWEVQSSQRRWQREQRSSRLRKLGAIGTLATVIGASAFAIWWMAQPKRPSETPANGVHMTVPAEAESNPQPPPVRLPTQSFSSDARDREQVIPRTELGRPTNQNTNPAFKTTSDPVLPGEDPTGEQQE